AIPDNEAALDEITRVLRPDGLLILVDHVVSTSRFIRAGQWLVERITVPLAGEHFLRRQLPLVRARGYTIVQAERFRHGLVERLVATRLQIGSASWRARGPHSRPGRAVTR